MATVRYDVLAAFVGPDNVSGNIASGDIKQLSRVQSSNYNIEIQRDNVMGLGTSFANDTVKESPFVNLSMEYLVTNGENEKNIGFVVDGTHGSLLNMDSGVRDYFILVNKPSETPIVMGVGNGVLMKYAVSAQVGSFVKANIDVRGFNIKVDMGTSGNYVPHVNVSGKQSSSITYQLPPVQQDTKSRTVGGIEDNIYVGPGNLEIKFPNNSAFGMVLSGDAKSHLQSFDFNVSLDRNEITKIGNRYPFKRCLSLPTSLTLSANFILSNFVADNIQNYFCQAHEDIEINVKSNTCTNTDMFWQSQGSKDKLKYLFKGMKMQSFASSDTLTDRKSVSITWAVPIGNILDLNRNLFMSGDFGSYLFPTSSVRTVSGEAGITGQALMPLTTEFVYERVKADVSTPEFNLVMSSNFDIYGGNPPYLTFFDGNSGIYDISGKFGSNIVQTTFPLNSDSYDTTVDGLPTSGFSYQYSTFTPQYFTGYPARLDAHTGIYNFAFNSKGFNTEPIEIAFAGLPTWITPYIQYPKFSIDPYKPYYFNSFGLGVNAVDVPTGTPFIFQMIARNSKFKKLYQFSGSTPYAFPVQLPQIYAKKVSLWLNPYDETKVSRDSNNFISGLDSSCLRTNHFNTISGSGTNPTYVYQGLNSKSYMNIDSGAFLQRTGTNRTYDFSNFSLFAVTRPSLTSESGASLLLFYQSNTGIVNAGNAAFFGRKALSQDFIFYYTNPTGTSGFSGVNSNTLQVTSAFDTNVFSLASVVFDGKVASGRKNGAVVGTQNLFILPSGNFDRIEVGSHDLHSDIAEMIFLPYRLQDSEILEVEAYLRYKWGF